MYLVWGKQAALEVYITYSAWQEGILFGDLLVRIQKGICKGKVV
jgi:hypothetical protein